MDRAGDQDEGVIERGAGLAATADDRTLDRRGPTGPVAPAPVTREPTTAEPERLARVPADRAVPFGSRPAGSRRSRRGGRRRDQAGPEPGGPPRPAFAAIDLGTNNCRLLMAEPAQDGIAVVDAFSRVVRLGEGVRATGRFCDAAMERTFCALRICASKLRRRPVTALRAVATEAARRAGNFEEFAWRVHRELAIDLERISPDEEAAMAAQGCAPLLMADKPRAIVFDIGGGSTEVMWIAVEPDATRAGGTRARVIDTISLPEGVVVLAEAHGDCGACETRYGRVIDQIRPALQAFDATWGISAQVAAGRVQMLGSSGTVTTLAGVSRELPRYDRSLVDGTFLEGETARRISRSLLGMDWRARASQPCIGKDRADLVVVGCAVLEAILDVWPIDRLRIADRGVREGILLDLMARWATSADPSAR